MVHSLLSCPPCFTFMGFYVSFILVLLKMALVPWTLQLWSVHSIDKTNKQGCWAIQGGQFFNKLMANWCIIVHMVHEMLNHQCNLKGGQTQKGAQQLKKLLIQSTKK